MNKNVLKGLSCLNLGCVNILMIIIKKASGLLNIRMARDKVSSFKLRIVFLTRVKYPYLEQIFAKSLGFLTLAIRIFTIHNQAMYGIAKRLITNGHKPLLWQIPHLGLWPFVISLFATSYMAYLFFFFLRLYSYRKSNKLQVTTNVTWFSLFCENHQFPFFKPKLGTGSSLGTFFSHFEYLARIKLIYELPTLPNSHPTSSHRLIIVGILES
jgi:hypothetical protein